MARFSSNRNNFIESQRRAPGAQSAAPFDESALDQPVRVTLIAIRHDSRPPVFLGPHLLQRLRALLTAAGEQMENGPAPLSEGMASAGAMGGAPPIAPRRLLPAMPPPPLWQMEDGTPLQPRLVRGEILSDSAGQLYEKIGRQVRSLKRVVSGPRGEILELVCDPRRHPSPNRRAATENDAPPDARTNPPSNAQPPTEPTSNGFANGEDRKMAANHRRPPYAKSRPNDPMRRPAAYNAPIPPRQPVREEVQVEQPLPQPVTQQPPPVAKQPEAKPIAGTQAARPVNLPVELKTAIPEQWVKPWEFRLSREEALYDMQFESASGNSIFGPVRNLGRRLGSRQSFRKWQSLLFGRSLDEQLWDVRPPSTQLAQPEVREWARRTLDQAGYDARAMLTEWEIFWRRKGL